MAQLSKEEALELESLLLDLRQHPGYSYLEGRCKDLLAQCQRLLEVEVDQLQLARHQGKVAAYKSVINLITDTIKQLKSEVE
jgi:hypothetical protein